MSSHKLKLAIAAAASVAAVSTLAFAARVSPLSPPPPAGTGLPAGQCLRTHDIRNHTLADDRTVLIDVSGRAIYRITVDPSCLAGATSTDPLVTRQPPGSTIVCKPIDLDLGISKGHGFTTRCIVHSIVRMTPEEVAALPPRLKP